MNKRSLQRRQLRQHLRQQISSTYLQWASQQACQCLLTSNLFIQAQYIACYWPMSREANCQPIIDACHQYHKQCYLPVINPHKPRDMHFRLYEPHTPLISNSLGILEPAEGSSTIAVSQLDLVITPLLGFDLKGYRLGQGGGYYDTAFAHKQQGRKPYLCGLALALQQVNDTQPEDWDVALDYIATEQGLLTTSD